MVRLELRGIGPAIIRRYLMDLGASETPVGTLVGDGWTASVEAGDPILIGALRIGLTIVTFAGDEATIQHVVAALKGKAIRAGG
jgi:hypothetical protein